MPDAGKDVREEIADRIGEAYQVLKRLPDRERRLLACQGSSWSAMICEPIKLETEALRVAQMRLPPPSGEQIDRMNEALGWITDLAINYTNAARVIYLSEGERRKKTYIAKLMGISRETVYKWRNSGLDTIATIRLRKKAA